MNTACIDPPSFRDPAGNKFHLDGKVLRTVNPIAVEDYEFVESTGLMEKLVEKGWCISSRIVDRALLGKAAGNARYVLEHPTIPFISYPYELSFSQLKDAALLTLEIQKQALGKGMSLRFPGAKTSGHP